VIENANGDRARASVNGTTTPPHLGDREAGAGRLGSPVNIPGTMIVILTVLDGASGFASMMKTATSTGRSLTVLSLYVNE